MRIYSSPHKTGPQTGPPTTPRNAKKAGRGVVGLGSWEQEHCGSRKVRKLSFKVLDHLLLLSHKESSHQKHYQAINYLKNIFLLLWNFCLNPHRFPTKNLYQFPLV
jgi:hypothetical protein